MSKQRRGRGPDKAPEEGVERGAPEALDQDVDVARSEVLGNAAFQASMGHEADWAPSVDLLAALARESAVAGLGGTVAAALRLEARPAAEHARMLAILEASELERRGELSERLASVQAVALAVDDAVREHLGALSAGERSSWASTFASARGSDAATVAAEVHEARGGRSPGAAALTALVASILQRATFLDEEEEPLGMDYATEESGM